MTAGAGGRPRPKPCFGRPRPAPPIHSPDGPKDGKQAETSMTSRGATRRPPPPGRPRSASQPRFGAYVREVRERLRKADRRYSLRQVAQRIHVQPAYLSQVERDNVAPPSEG